MKATGARAGWCRQGPGEGVDVTGTVGGWRPRSPALSGAASGSSGDLAQARGAPPHSPGAEHSRAASSTRPRPFMAAGSMLRAGLGKARGLWAEVLWARAWQGEASVRSPSLLPSPKPPPLFWHGIAMYPLLGISELGGEIVRKLAKPHPQPIPQSVHHHSIPSRENRSAVSGRVTARNAPTRSWHLWGGGSGGARLLLLGER